MYITVDELAEYLALPLEYLQDQIRKGNIKAIFDGNQYLVNKNQFEWHKQQLDLKIEELRREALEDIPDDIDVKDED
ncbi:excisionase family DNA-binding protein [Alkalihalobacterium elongatum]|uniref:excisionase family DNA-binding protein n=1 Tax=Alkalihalobacterium elongatum TaxID=2675466 RepID=UPI001C1F3B74|nr:excisionase family DNA-binding protein [Alkalihalobacterium elongatum]